VPADGGEDRDRRPPFGERVERAVVDVAHERIDEDERLLGGVGDAADLRSPVGGIVLRLPRLPVGMTRRPPPQASRELAKFHVWSVMRRTMTA
jgi:hypothetical protein